MPRGIATTWEISALTVKMLTRMVVGEVSLKNMSGPLTIADYAGGPGIIASSRSMRRRT